MIQYIPFKNFDRKHFYNRYFVTLNERTFIFVVTWNLFANCAVLSIYDYENNPIVTGLSLVNGLFIRKFLLPYNFIFSQINGETYEPTIDNLSNEFVLAFEDGQ